MFARLLATVLLSSIANASMALSTDSDDVAIQILQSKQAAAWNAHDARAYAALFTPDGDIVNVLGWSWKGRDEIQGKLADAFAIAFRDSQLTITNVEVRKLSPDIAVAHVRWSMRGALPPPGASAAPGQGIQLQVLVRSSDGWRITSFQNTNSIPERPFPRTSPATH